MEKRNHWPIGFNRSRANITKQKVDTDRPTKTAVIRNDDLDNDSVDDKFFRLEPTEIGRQKLNNIRRRRSSRELGYDPGEAEFMLDQVIEKIQANKYGKGMDIRSRTILDSLVKAFLRIDQSNPGAADINATIRLLIKVCKSYYEYDEKQRQFLDDETYDQVVARWRSMGFEEPTGYVPDRNRKTAVRHPRLHNNMDKAYRVYINDPIPVGVKESDSVENWLIRSFKALGLTSESTVDIEVSPKIDGTSGSGDVTANGQWHNPQTRGDDSESLDIKGMDGLELADEKIVRHPFAIQYEIFCTEPDRLGASVYLEKDPPYVGCRQASSGIVNRLCTGDDNELLQFASLYPIEADGLDEMPYLKRMEYLSNFAIVPSDMITRRVIRGNMKYILRELKDMFKQWEKDRENHTFTYDGMVLTFADDDYQRILGRQGRTNQYQIALKFDPASATAKVAGIHLGFGKKGFRTIQVDLEHAVFLDGVRYDHVPVLSAKLFRDLDLRMNDIVRINRTGDVMPAITVEKSTGGKRIPAPTTCPDCGHPLQIKNSKFYCGNPNCASNLSGRIQFFLKALGIDRYGESFADTIVETFDNRILDADGHTVGHSKSFGVNGIADLFELTPQMFESVGITTKDAKLFRERLMSAMSRTADYEVLGALGIPDVGRARAYDILKTVGGLESLIANFNRLILRMALINAVGEGIGEKVYDALTSNDGYKELQKDIRQVSHYVTRFTNFDEKSVRIGHTGISKLPDDVMEIIQRRGFMVVDGKNFDILLAADIHSGSGKIQAANKKKLPVMTLDGFRKQYGN